LKVKLPFDHPRFGMMLVEVALDDPEVAGVRTEHEVEHVAGEGHETDRGVEPDVPGHAPELPLRHAEVPRFPHQIRAEGLLSAANIYIPIGAPLRWSMVRGTVDGFASNAWAWHPLPDMATIPR
jgi:hypothetical protein